MQVNANDYSFYMFASRMWLRRGLRSIVFDVWFDRVMLFLILASCGFMAAQDPLCQSDECCRSSMRCQVSALNGNQHHCTLLQHTLMSWRINKIIVTHRCMSHIGAVACQLHGCAC